jgi:hypothetical protein
MMLDKARVEELSFDEKIEAAFADAAEEVIRKARQFKTTIVVEENGVIREYTPDEFEKKLKEKK